MTGLIRLPDDPEDEEGTKNKARRVEDSLTFKFPFLSGKISGQHVIFAIVIFCFAVPVIASVYYHHMEQARVVQLSVEQNTDTAKRLISIEKFMDKNQQTQEAIIYILSLSQEDKVKLSLSKPQIIRELEGFTREERRTRDGR